MQENFYCIITVKPKIDAKQEKMHPMRYLKTLIIYDRKCIFFWGMARGAPPGFLLQIRPRACQLTSGFPLQSFARAQK